MHFRPLILSTVAEFSKMVKKLRTISQTRLHPKESRDYRNCLGIALKGGILSGSPPPRVTIDRVSSQKGQEVAPTTLKALWRGLPLIIQTHDRRLKGPSLLWCHALVPAH